MSDQPFAVGDVVRLKSGSHKMTVSLVPGEDSVHVVFFPMFCDGTWGEPMEHAYPADALDKVS